jgi:predicted porin
MSFEENKFYIPVCFNGKIGEQNLVNRPDLWEIGVEYDFEDGLFGQRFKGVINANINTAADTLLNVSDVSSIIDFGGHYSNGAGINLCFCSTYFNGTNITETSGIYIDQGVIHFWTLRNANIRVNEPYDIWVKYTK